MGAGVIKGAGGGGRRGRRRRGNAAAMSEINVTPFVDVMLVLLIIFMVAAPLLTVGVPIELPETAAKSPTHLIPSTCSIRWPTTPTPSPSAPPHSLWIQTMTTSTSAKPHSLSTWLPGRLLPILPTSKT